MALEHKEKYGGHVDSKFLHGFSGPRGFLIRRYGGKWNHMGMGLYGPRLSRVVSSFSVGAEPCIFDSASVWGKMEPSGYGSRLNGWIFSPCLHLTAGFNRVPELGLWLFGAEPKDFWGFGFGLGGENGTIWRSQELLSPCFHESRATHFGYV